VRKAREALAVEGRLARPGENGVELPQL
jgi:hypothetical protein